MLYQAQEPFISPSSISR